MHIDDVLYYGFWAGLFFLMMRFGCGHHIMGHGDRHRHIAPTIPETPRGGTPLPWSPRKEHQ